MLQKSGRLYIVCMIEDEFRVLGGGADEILAKLFPPQCAIHERHGNRLALCLTKDKAVAACELWGLCLGAGELVDGLTFREGHFADLYRKAQFGDVHFHCDGADAQFADKGVVARVATLRGIGETKGES